jgi:NitT/TauT family transport system substrate-binding protein
MAAPVYRAHKSAAPKHSGLALSTFLFFIWDGRRVRAIPIPSTACSKLLPASVKRPREMKTMGLLDVGRLRRSVALAMSAILFASAACAQTSLKVSLEGRIEGPAALFYLPLDKGYFSAEGLDVGIEPATSATESIARVASGEFAIGIADVNALITYRDQNPAAPVKAVFMVYNKPPHAIVARKNRGISGPKSLEGKRIGSSPGLATDALWPLFAELNGIDTSKVTFENINPLLRAPMLAAGQIDATLGYSFSAYVNLKDRGVPLTDIVLLPMADYGLDVYGSAILVNTKFAAEQPDAVKGFLRAFLKGLKDVVRRPSDGADSILERNDLTGKGTEVERLRMVVRDNIVTPEVKANGYGAVNPGRLGSAIDQLALVHVFKNRPKPDDIFDASFLPSAAERKAN